MSGYWIICALMYLAGFYYAYKVSKEKEKENEK